MPQEAKEFGATAGVTNENHAVGPRGSESAATPWRKGDGVDLSGVAAKVREDQKGTAKSIIHSLVLFSKLPADKKGVLEKAALPQLTYDERMLLPSAYPDILNPVPMVVTAIAGWRSDDDVS